MSASYSGTGASTLVPTPTATLRLVDVALVEEAVSWQEANCAGWRARAERAEAEVARLRRVVTASVRDLEDAGADPGLVMRLDDGARGVVTCGSCGVVHGQDLLAWREWVELGIDVAECGCGTTLGRVR